MAAENEHVPIMGKRLYRSRRDRLLFGVLGGIGMYLGTDPTVVRLVFVILMLLTGVIPGVILYFLAAVLVPEEV